MNESLLNRILKDRKRRTRSLALILCLSMIVSLGTFAGFHKNAIAKVYTREVLDCPYTHEGAEPVAHVHNDDCYDGKTLVCTLPELEAHTHSDACYTESQVLTCTLEENPGHQHGDACYTEREELRCGLEENPGHQHGDACYTEREVLRCGLEENPGHQHGEACYDENGVLTCQIPEGEGAHTHTAECYETVRELTCQIPEGEGAHAHTAECYETVRELSCQIPEGEGAHAHTAECYETVRELTCGKQELTPHVHGPECIRKEEITVDEPEVSTEPEATTVPEMPVSDPNADLESASDWERDFDGMELSGNWAEDLVLVAATQQGHGESQNNFEAVLNDAGDAWVRHGYTRYGAWSGAPYADEWSAMFVSFCLRYAGIPAENVPNNPTAALMAESFQKGELFAGPDYLPAVGDLIFFDTDDEEGIDHMGIVYHVDEEDGSLNTVEGSRTDAVETFGYKLDDEEIAGYGILPQNPNDIPDVIENEDNIEGEDGENNGFIVMTNDEEEDEEKKETEEVNEETKTTEETKTVEEVAAPEIPMPAQNWERTAGGIKVSVEAPEGAFPENTKIAVTPVSGDSLKDTVSDAVSGEVLEVQAVDITFFDADGNEIEPAVPIRVVMTPAETQNAEEKANVVHIDLDQQTAEVIAQAEGTETDNSEVVFDAEAFTIYAIVYTMDTYFRSYTGETYRVTMDFDESAYIPQNAKLEVNEILEENEEYSDLLLQAEDALKQNGQISYIRFFDISIMSDGEEVQPSAPVSVKIQLADLPEADQTDAQVLHFGSQTEVLEAETAGAQVSFEARGFSVYAVAYTVDFVYEEDGKVLKWSFPGRGSYPVADIMSKLGVESPIEDVSLELAQGEKVEGALYLTEVEGEHFLNSDVPFHDTYELTVVSDSKTYRIIVTDAEQCTFTYSVYAENGNIEFTEGPWYVLAQVSREDGTYSYVKKLDENELYHNVAIDPVYHWESEWYSGQASHTIDSDFISYALVRPKDSNQSDNSPSYFCNADNMNVKALSGSSVDSMYTLQVVTNGQHTDLILVKGPDAQIKIVSKDKNGAEQDAPVLNGKYFVVGQLSFRDGLEDKDCYAVQELGASDLYTINKGFYGWINGNRETQYLTGTRSFEPFLAYDPSGTLTSDDVWDKLAKENGNELVIYRNGSPVENYRLTAADGTRENPTGSITLEGLPDLTAEASVQSADGSPAKFDSEEGPVSLLLEIDRDGEKAYSLKKLSFDPDGKMPASLVENFKQHQVRPGIIPQMIH